ncbi:sugar ABC transporter substrate-binding protein [uncultured Nocardioides sp.]|uniref:ABC transporter substrate-binding protein n=1 Tax=uncultured Nocardioides sp. TaxID=198441 RepID=UPI00260B261E|nr:sugar ABC transporter substrate-binding protein [uncultured Nocardioides sp.]
MSPPPPQLSRRAALRGAALAGLLPLGGCAGLTRRVSSTAPGGRDRLTVQVYGTDVEADLYVELARRFSEARGVTVDVTYVPFAEALTAVDSGLLAGTAPDVFRVDYPTMGLYSGTGQLLDLTDATAELARDVSPAYMGAVSSGDRVYGVPQHVDTSALLYRRDAFEAAGITVPDRGEDAWSWEEFGEVADRLRDSAEADGTGRAPFAVNWQEFGAFRWLTWLFEAGGQLYTEDLGSAALTEGGADGPGARALEFTRSFFERGWVPRATSTKATTLPDALFTSGRLGMVFAGNFLLPAFAETIGDRFGYGATFQPQDARRSSELGGNALVANADAANPELAAEFLTYMVEPDQMATFCAEGVLLPTRTSLLEQGLDFAIGADLMGVYADQIRTITDRDVADVTTPTFAEVNTVLANELEQCFLGDASVSDTLDAIAERVDQTATLNEAAP